MKKLFKSNFSNEQVEKENVQKKQKGIIQYELIPEFLKLILLDENLEEIDYRGNKIYFNSNSKINKNLELDQTHELENWIQQNLLTSTSNENKANLINELNLRIVVNKKISKLNIEQIEYIESLKLSSILVSEKLSKVKNITFCKIKIHKEITDEHVFEMLMNNDDISDESGDIFESISNLIDINTLPTILISGQTGSGKNAFQKWVMGQVDEGHKTIVLYEDNENTSLSSIYPEKDILEIYDNSNFSMNENVESILKLNPDYIVVSDIKGKDIDSFLKFIKTGHPVNGIFNSSSALNTFSIMAEEYIKTMGINEKVEKQSIQIEQLIDVVIHLKKFYFKNEQDEFRCERKINQISKLNPETKRHEIIYNFESEYE